MTPHPSLSVVIPTHRPIGVVAAALDALGQQTLPRQRFEVVVVLDGLDAGRGAQLAVRRDPFRLVVVASPRRGRAAACNLGAATARGEVLLFLDDDMRLDADGLRAHLAHHGPQARRAVVGAAPVRLHAGAPFAARHVARRFDRHLAKLADPGHRMDVRDVYTGAFSIPRATFMAVGGFDERFVEYGNEDGDLAGRLLSAGVELVYAADAVAHQTYDKTFPELAADHLAKGRTAVQFLSVHPERAAESAVRRATPASRRRRLVRTVTSRLVAAPGRRALVLTATDAVAGALDRRRPQLADRLAAVVLEGCFWAGVAEARSAAPAAARTVVHYTDSTTSGGVARVVLSLAAGLDRRHWRPVLVVHATPGVLPMVHEAALLGVEVVEVPPLHGPGIRDVVVLARAFHRLRPAVVHVHRSWARSGTAAVLGARVAGRAGVVATEHLFLPTTPRRTLAARRLLDRLVDQHVAVSEALGSVLLERFHLRSDRVRVIPNGIVPAAPPAPAAVARLRDDWLGRASWAAIVVPARLDRQKGHATLLAALPRVPGVLAVLAGDGPERGRLEQLAGTLGVADRVLFLGHREDAAAVMAAADLVVLPSFAEGMPLAVLEACALGRPVIASDVGGVGEVLPREAGRLVPAGDAAALAEAIEAVLADPAAAARMGVAGTRAAAEFTVERMVARVERLYEELPFAPGARTWFRDRFAPGARTWFRDRQGGPGPGDVRALDWRFLVGRDRFDRIADFRSVGRHGSFGRLVDIAAEVVDGSRAATGSADLAAATAVDRSTLARVADVLVPGGSAVVRSRVLLGRVETRFRRAGLTDVRVFAPWPSPVRPRAWLPLDDAEACARVLGDAPDGGPRRRLGHLRRRWWLWRARRGLGAVQYLVAGRDVDAVPPPGSALAPARVVWRSATGRPAPERLTATLLTGGRESISKVSVVVTATGTRRPGVVLKWPRTAEGGRGLSHEAEVLDALAGITGPTGGSAPTVLARFSTEAGPALIETLLDGVPLAQRLDRTTHSAVAVSAADWLADLAERTTTGVGSGPEAAQRLVEEFTRLVGDAVDPSLLAVGRTLPGVLQSVPGVLEHRDVAPWNVLMGRERQLQVVDWESAVRVGLPLLDLWYFLTWAGLAVERTPEARLAQAYPRLVDPRSATGQVSEVAVERYATRLGLDHAALGPLRALTWMAHVPAEMARLHRRFPDTTDRERARDSLFLRLWAHEVRVARSRS